MIYIVLVLFTDSTDIVMVIEIQKYVFLIDNIIHHYLLHKFINKTKKFTIFAQYFIKARDSLATNQKNKYYEIDERVF